MMRFECKFDVFYNKTEILKATQKRSSRRRYFHIFFDQINQTKSLTRISH